MPFFFVAPPQPTLSYHDRYITLNQLEIINSSVTAFPQPSFQWIRVSTGELFPESSWSSMYHDKMAYSTLMYRFEAQDLYTPAACTTVIICRAINTYGISEQYFTLIKFKNCTLSTSRASPTPIVTSNDDNDMQHNGFEAVTSIVAIAVLLVVLVVCNCAVIILLTCLLKRKR